jgi:predicted dehydrogenase
MTRDALEAGKHVVVEKPFVRKSVEGEELLELAAKNGRMISVFQNRRWDGDFLTVKKIIQEGQLGRLVEYEAHFDRYRNYIQENKWKEIVGSGSTLYNLGSHLIDQAMVLFGRPEYVYADIRTLRTGGKVDDAFTLMLGYPGVKVTLKASYLVSLPGPRYYLHGTQGSFLKYGCDPQEEALKKGRKPGGSDWGMEPESDWGILHTVSEGSGHPLKYESLAGNYPQYYNGIYRALSQGTEPPVTGEQALEVIRVIEAAFQSNRSGRRESL